MSFLGLLVGHTRGKFSSRQSLLTPLTGKKGNRFFYKGKRVRKRGTLTRKGQFLVSIEKLPLIATPVENEALKPYVAVNRPPPSVEA